MKEISVARRARDAPEALRGRTKKWDGRRNEAFNGPAMNRLRLAALLGVAPFSCWVFACAGETAGGGTAADGGVQGGNDGAVETGSSEDARSTIDANDAVTIADIADDSVATVDADAGLIECDTRVVTCRSLPPACPPGQVPVTSGTCWAGYCVKPSACRSLKDCTDCPADGYVCAVDTHDDGETLTRCPELPASCELDRTCSCLSPYICTRLRSCADLGNGHEFHCFDL